MKNLLMICLCAITFSPFAWAQTLQNGTYTRTIQGMSQYAQIEHTGSSIMVTADNNYVQEYTLKSSNHYTRTYVNPYNSNIVYHYEIFVLSNTEFSIEKIGTGDKQIWTYKETMSNEDILTSDNCECEDSEKAQEYFDKAMEPNQAHTCTYCAQLALFQCYQACSTTVLSQSEIQNTILALKSILNSFIEEGNSICCPELMAKE